MLFNEVTRRLSSAPPGAIQHLMVLLPVPIVYPKIPVSESLLQALQGGMRNNKSFRDTLVKLTGKDSGPYCSVPHIPLPCHMPQCPASCRAGSCASAVHCKWVW